MKAYPAVLGNQCSYSRRAKLYSSLFAGKWNHRRATACVQEWQGERKFYPAARPPTAEADCRAVSPDWPCLGSAEAVSAAGLNDVRRTRAQAGPNVSVGLWLR